MSSQRIAGWTPPLPLSAAKVTLSVLLASIVFLESSVLADPTSPRSQVSAPNVWQVSQWAVPQGESTAEMLASVAGAATHYRRVLIAGNGRMADSVFKALQDRIGNSRIVRTTALNFGEDSNSSAGDTRFDLIIHATDATPRPAP